ncbi:MAG: alpha/beta hydrolase [Bacteroidota bacterium]
MVITINGKKIFFTAQGRGNTVVLLHGFTETLDIWNDFAVRLSANFHVITIDLPGHGRSECLGEIHTMEAMAECVHAVLKSQRVTECAMAGHSMGGYVMLAFAEKYEEMMRGLCLFHSTAYADTPDGKVNRQRTIDVIKKNHAGFISNFIPELFAPANRSLLKREIQTLTEAARGMTKESIIASQRGMLERPDRSHVLKNCPVPVLIIAGKLDSRIPYEKVLQQMALPNDCIALLMGDVAHMGYLEATEKTFYALNSYLDGLW